MVNRLKKKPKVSRSEIVRFANFHYGINFFGEKKKDTPARRAKRNARKTKDNALRYLYTMLVVKMRSKKREVGARRGCAEDGRGWHKGGEDGDEDEGVGREGGTEPARYV